MNTQKLRQIAYQTLLNLASEEGLNAAGKEEIFGCIFGRDSAITILKILKTHSQKPDPVLLEISKRALLHLIDLQGTQLNIESGEQPGKFIHEFRKSKFDHLIKSDKPWFIYPDGFLRNYDSIDSTPLLLIALYKYWQVTKDNEFLITILPAVEAALNWIITYGDLDKDFLIEYDFPKSRKYGGLSIQSWTDSHQSLIDKDGSIPSYPIAPIEVQAFSWLALKLWSDFYTSSSPSFAKKISSQAKNLKAVFNKKFIIKNQELFYGAQALDGNKKQIKTITANPLLCLWASYTKNGKTESIIDKKYLVDFVCRAFKDDLFVVDAGIRTMSSKSHSFNSGQDSYHNGSFWPMLNGLIIEGLENFGFREEAEKLRQASLLPLLHFNCPIELYHKDDSGYLEYQSPHGQVGCREQAWTAATILDLITDNF